MSMAVHNLMAFNHQYFRPQPVVQPKPQRNDDKAQSFQDILDEKLKSMNSMKR
ncbi:hypothetical protein [Paenibacillus sp. NFR01]|uniref:hypothetical protein n=1 Tax=Paenibacillus sp. NFR01 TaxID=1566279 RepID=UPI0008B843AE|nr:hypothetical protein [Paenibacillus sp. NFR01]SET34852.1 hypothetical protein SAMN03159358_1413 [Paenibacillus sp. NFR01]